METSPSVNEAQADESNSQNEDLESEYSSDDEQVMNSLDDPEICTACAYDSKLNKEMCFNGIRRVPKEECEDFDWF